METLDESDFIRVIAEEFKIRHVSSMSDRLVDELGLDSVDMVDLIGYVEELSAVESIEDPEVYPILRTLNDAYLYYLDLIDNVASRD